MSETSTTTNNRKPPRTQWAVANPLAAAEEVQNMGWAIQAMEHELTVYVGLLREAGWSWGKVGDALSMTRQGAAQRYAKSSALELSKLQAQADDEAHPEAAEAAQAYLSRLQRRLSVRTVRERYEVRGPSGDLISRHYVEERAALALSRAPEGSTMGLVKLRDDVRTGGPLRCRTCGELHCLCEDGRTHGVADEVARAASMVSTPAPDDETSF